MKRLIILTALVFICAVVAQAQTSAWLRTGDTYKVWQGGVDTLTNADTLTYEFPSELSADWEYNIQVVTDSLTGATAGTAKLWVSDDPDEEVWYNKESITINGATQQNTLWTGEFTYPKMKIVFITAGNQTTKARFWWVLKR